MTTNEELRSISSLQDVDLLNSMLRGLSIVISHWPGSLAVPDTKITVQNQEGQQKDVSKKVKPPRVALDIHPTFKRLRDNRTRIKHVLKRYSVPDKIRGAYLIPANRKDELDTQLCELRQEREQLARAVTDSWDEIILQLQQVHPDSFHKFAGRIPNKRSMVYRHRMVWEFSVLSILPTRDESIDTMRERMQGIFNDLFDGVEETAEEILRGGYETGGRKSGAVRNMMSMLERIQNFSIFATPDVLDRASRAVEFLRGITVQDINADPGEDQQSHARRGLRNVFRPLAAAVRSWRAELGTARVARSVGVNVDIDGVPLENVNERIDAPDAARRVRGIDESDSSRRTRGSDHLDGLI